MNCKMREVRKAREKREREHKIKFVDRVSKHLDKDMTWLQKIIRRIQVARRTREYDKRNR